MTFTVGEDQHERSYVLRYPAEPTLWNARLVVGVHGETGSRVRKGPGGQVLGTHETQLDDIIGDHALHTGYAYASVERAGFGGKDRGLWLLDQFAQVIRARLSAALQSPERLYAVGWSTGGTLARYAAEDTTSLFDGVIVIAGVEGRTDERQGVPGVPTIEIVGTGDAPVAERVRAYRDYVNRVSAELESPTPADRFRLYQVAGAGHVSPEDDDIASFDDDDIGETSYFPVVHTALDLLDRWVSEGIAPPEDHVVEPPANIRQR